MGPIGDGSLKAPPIAALFVTTFDTRIGYTLTWKRSQPGIELEGEVEYKSLPSGLHKLERDLIYFTHGAYTGLSAFQAAPAGSEERNARFVAVGALVPLSAGKLGRAWMHAEGLRDLADTVSKEGVTEDRLERVWEECRLRGAEIGRHHDSSRHRDQRDRSADSRSRSRRGRTMSDATGAIFQDTLLDADHPALAMRDFIDLFGPLCFVVQRAALLRQRIIITGDPPVQNLCDFVYAICIFSSIPWSINEPLKITQNLLRTTLLFNVGVHDIPELEGYKSGGEILGFVACTTDKILTTKTQLYDVRISMSANRDTQWPLIETSDGRSVKATQRDLRRYRLLQRELDKARKSRSSRRSRSISHTQPSTAADDDTEPLITAVTQDSLALTLAEEQAIIEPVSWASIAYTSILWWASSGQGDIAWEEEAIQDASLLEDLTQPDSRHASRNASPASSMHRSRDRKGASVSPARNRSISSRRRGSLADETSVLALERQHRQTEAMLLTAFFHRLTGVYLQPLAERLNATSDDVSESAVNGSDAHRVHDVDEIELSTDDMRTMGLDPWSLADRHFVVHLAQRLFLMPRRDRREVTVPGGIGPLTVCGIQIC